MSENYNDDEIIDSSEDTEKKRNKSEKFCFLCRRPESKAGPMIELPNNIHVCTDCMQKSFNSMNIDIESCVDDEYDWSPRGEIHKESAWANSGGKDGYALFWNVIEIDDRAFQNK